MKINKIGFVAVLAIFALTTIGAGCSIFTSQKTVTEPAGGYQFVIPSKWEQVTPTSDLLATDPDVVTYTVVNIPNTAVKNIFTVVRNTINPAEAVNKMISGLDWDFAKVISSEKFSYLTTKVPATSVEVSLGEGSFEIIAFEIDKNVYVLYNGKMSKDWSSYKAEINKIIKTFDKY